MSLPFPGPSRPRSSLSRRGVLGGLAVLAVASTVDVVRMLVRSGGRSALADHTGLDPQVVSLLTGNLRPQDTTPSSRPTEPAPSPHPPHTHAPAHHHGHANAHAHSHGHHAAHAHSHHDQHETKKERAQARRAREHVNLPPAQLSVRARPAYRLDQLIPNPPEQALALTIDDGPDPEYTPDVLRLLDKYGMQASFCVVGVHADAYPKLVRDISRAGHIVVNHSYTHVLPFSRLTREADRHGDHQDAARDRAGRRRDAATVPRTGGRLVTLHPPRLSRRTVSSHSTGMSTRATGRARGPRRSRKRMLRARPGDIVLCHDGGGDRIETVRALRKVLPTWQRKRSAHDPARTSRRTSPVSDHRLHLRRRLRP